MIASGPCVWCGKDPAEGTASVWSVRDGWQRVCHGDGEGPTCYELATRRVGPPGGDEPGRSSRILAGG